jgi:hypothetical protein
LRFSESSCILGGEMDREGVECKWRAGREPRRVDIKEDVD